MPKPPHSVSISPNEDGQFCEQDLADFCNLSGIILRLLPLSSGCPSGIYLIQNSHPTFVLRDDLHGALRLCVAKHLIIAFQHHIPGKFAALASRHGVVVLAEVELAPESKADTTLRILESLPLLAFPLIRVAVHFYEEIFT